MRTIICLTFLILPLLLFSQTESQSLPTQSFKDSSSFPAYDKQWTTAEFGQALTLIIDRQKNDSIYMSVANDSNLFNKVASYDNYWFLESKNIPLAEKIPSNLELSPRVRIILQNYYLKGRNSNGKYRYEKEITGFMILLLKMTTNQNDLVNEFISTNQNLSPIQLDGIKKMKSGIATIITGELVVLESEYKFYSEESICKIAAAFRNFYLANSNMLSTELKIDFDKKITSISAKHSLQCVRAALKGE